MTWKLALGVPGKFEDEIVNELMQKPDFKFKFDAGKMYYWVPENDFNKEIKSEYS